MTRPKRDIQITRVNRNEAQTFTLLSQKPDGSAVFFSGEALYAGRDMGTVEAALPMATQLGATGEATETGSKEVPVLRLRRAWRWMQARG